jgi:hypothetical protein
MPLSAAAPSLRNLPERFIGKQLPDWLGKASSKALLSLRTALVAHLASQRKMSALAARLQPIDSFAQAHLARPLGLSVPLDQLVWREERRRLKVAQGSLSDHESYFVRMPALQKFMQNFKAAESFFELTALVPAVVAPGQEEQLVSTDIDALVTACRSADAGKAYQEHLSSHLTAQFECDLALDKRLQLSLAIEIAVLKGQLEGDNLRMLRQLANGTQPTHPLSRRVEVGGLQVLGCRVEGALAIELRGSWAAATGVIFNPEPVQGVMLYLPDDEERPLQYYADWREANRALVTAVARSGYRTAFGQRIALSDLAGYQTLLATRLQDDRPDLQPRTQAVSGDTFKQLAAWHVQRVKDDARFLVVPTADADNKASAQRLRQLEGAGLVLLNLAGLFVPGVGALLLADMVRQTLGEVFEGVADWSQGHQHEAVQHMLQVALSVATTGAVAGAGYALRSAFVEGLEPVTTEAGEARLWRNDLTPYQETSPPTGLTERDDGFLSDGHRTWWRCEQKCYRVRQDSEGTWRLLHRDGPSRYGPALRGNGERAWRLSTERPLEWQGAARLLSRLWPAAQALAPERMAEILRVADVQEEYLRGLLVESRPMSVQLRDTLERFAVDARLDTFFTQPMEASTDPELFQWCLDDLDVRDLSPQAQAAAIELHAAGLRERLFEHLSTRYLTVDPLKALITRDFPGLPDAYALEVLSHADAGQRARMQETDRVPLSLAERARAGLYQARLTRTREALYLRSSYRDDAAGLAFALLRRQGLQQVDTNLELRRGSPLGALQERLLPQQSGQGTVIMVWQEGAFQLYDERGLPLEKDVPEPAGLFETLVTCLPQALMERQGWVGPQAAERLRSALQGWLPEDGKALSRLLGWREARPVGAAMHRLANGKVGYLLGGHGSKRTSRPAAEQALRDRIRGLYPAFDDEQVERYLLILQNHGGSPFNSLLHQELQYSALDVSLRAWTRQVSGTAQNDRHRVAEAFRRAWRLEGEQAQDHLGNAGGLRVSIIATPVGELPSLPVGTDFSHVSELALVGLRLEALPQGFLATFTGLRQLDLSNNALRRLPEDLDSLAALRYLGLRRNRIRLDVAQATVLGNRLQMRTLDLSDNPLGSAHLDLSALVRLRDLRLRRSGLMTMPVGLQRCVRLEYADLRDNQITHLPQALLDAPLQLRQTLNVSGNALPPALRERLYAPAQPPALPAVVECPNDQARRLWLATQPEANQSERTQLWQDLHAEPDSGAFFELLAGLTQSAEFLQAGQELGARTWRMMEALAADQRMRRELFELAAEPRACADNLINCFSTLEVRLHVLQATQGGDPIATRSERWLLAQRLYRLDTVLTLARADIQGRYADGQWQRGSHAAEEVEVSLAYRTGLADRLNLIGQPRHMLFQSLAGVSQADLDRAYVAVLSAEATDERLRYISQRDFWLAVLRAEHRADFEAIEQRFDTAMDTLDSRMQSLGSGEYDTQARQLMRDRQSALDELALRLTREEHRRP